VSDKLVKQAVGQPTDYTVQNSSAKIRFGLNPANAGDNSNKMTLDPQDSRFSQRERAPGSGLSFRSDFMREPWAYTNGPRH
jgi:hypothetical protein